MTYFHRAGGGSFCFGRLSGSAFSSVPSLAGVRGTIPSTYVIKKTALPAPTTGLPVNAGPDLTVSGRHTVGADGISGAASVFLPAVDEKAAPAMKGSRRGKNTLAPLNPRINNALNRFPEIAAAIKDANEGIKNNHLGRALDKYEGLLKQHEFLLGSLLVRINVGVIYALGGDIDKALRCFEYAIELYERKPALPRELARSLRHFSVLLREGDRIRDAWNIAEKAVAIDKSGVKNYLEFFRVLAGSRQYGRSGGIIESVVELKGKDVAWPYLLKAWAFRERAHSYPYEVSSSRGHLVAVISAMLDYCRADSAGREEAKTDEPEIFSQLRIGLNGRQLPVKKSGLRCEVPLRVTPAVLLPMKKSPLYHFIKGFLIWDLFDQNEALLIFQKAHELNQNLKVDEFEPVIAEGYARALLAMERKDEAVKVIDEGLEKAGDSLAGIYIRPLHGLRVEITGSSGE